MSEDLRPDDGLGGIPSQMRRSTSTEKERPLTDREVPLGQLETESRILAPAIHAWLDGALPEASVRRGATAPDVIFWNRVNENADSLRRVLAPINLEARIMDAIPRSAPQVITPWWRREFVVTPSAALSAMAAAVVLTATITAFLVRAAG